MLKKDIIFQNPLRPMGESIEKALAAGEFGAVLARAGVGKTALVVQLALTTLLNEKNVLHVSLNDPVSKVSLWYKEVFRNISSQYDMNDINPLWESILTHRFIMTFNVKGFSPDKLDERLADLTEQGVFSPQMILIDGFPFDESVETNLRQLKSLAKKHSVSAWFTVRTHRHMKPGPDGMPMQLLNVSDFFEIVFLLKPEGKEIHVNVLKGKENKFIHPNMLLEPSTRLIKGD